MKCIKLFVKLICNFLLVNHIISYPLNQPMDNNGGKFQICHWLKHFTDFTTYGHNLYNVEAFVKTYNKLVSLRIKLTF